jgi:hypothetical protein
LVCRDEQGVPVNNANAGIRKVNAALLIAKLVPPPEFPRLAPLAIREHCNANKHVLNTVELAKDTADNISWNKDAPDSQAQLAAHYYYVRSPPHLCVPFTTH